MEGVAGVGKLEGDAVNADTYTHLSLSLTISIINNSNLLSSRSTLKSLLSSHLAVQLLRWRMNMSFPTTVVQVRGFRDTSSLNCVIIILNVANTVTR